MIMIARLLNGEEILGEIVTDGEMNLQSEIAIKNPTYISAGRNPKTENIDIHMAPWLPLSSEKVVKISRSMILCLYVPVAEMVNKYNSIFGSGLILPNSAGIEVASL